MDVKKLGKADLTPEEEKEFDKMVEQAGEDISKKQATVNFRWTQAEIERCKKIAEKKGLPYQTYIKSVLKQAMDKEDVA